MAHLRGVPCLPADAASALIAAWRNPVVSQAQAGEHLGRQGRMDDGLFVILDGVVRLYRTATNGREQVLWTLCDRDCFCLSPPCACCKSTCSAEALVPTRYLRIPGRICENLFCERPDAQMRVVGCLSRQREQLADLAESLATRPVDERLANVLAHLASRKGKPIAAGVRLDLGVTREQLAAAVGSVPGVITRILARWERDGLVTRRRGALLLTDPARLAAMRFSAAIATLAWC